MNNPTKRFAVILCLLMAGVLTSSCSSGKKGGSNPHPGTPLKTTVMVYMEGSNLEGAYDPEYLPNSAASYNIMEMMKSGNSDYLTVYLETGASDMEHADTDPLPVKDWATVQRHIIQNGRIETTANLGTGCNVGAGLTSNCIDMGNPEVLADFIISSVKASPADRYILIMWNHGGGSIGGYGGSEATSMDVNSLKTAFDKAKAETGVHFDIIGFDACLMATAEYAYNFTDYGKYYVASEALEPGMGWSYRPFMENLARYPAIPTEEITKIIIDTFIAQYPDDNSVTLSSLDLSKARGIRDAVNSFAAFALTLFSGDTDNKTLPWIEIFSARNNSDEFGALYTDNYFFNDTDIASFAGGLNYFNAPRFQPYADAMITAVENTVVYNKTKSKFQDSKGSSFYMPFHGFTNKSQELAKYGTFNFSDNYTELLKTLVDFANNTATVFDLAPPVMDTSKKASINVLSNFGIDDAFLFYDNDNNPDTISPFIAGVGGISFNASDITSYNVVIDASKGVLAINGSPVFANIVNRQNNYSEAYNLQIQLCYTPPGKTGFVPASLGASYDFYTGESHIDNYVFLQNSQGRDGVYIGKGETLRPANLQIPSNGGDPVIICGSPLPAGLTLAMAQLTGGTNSYIFSISNLKNEVIASPIFGPSGTINASISAGKPNAAKEAFEKAMNKPFWHWKKD